MCTRSFEGTQSTAERAAVTAWAKEATVAGAMAVGTLGWVEEALVVWAVGSWAE